MSNLARFALIQPRSVRSNVPVTHKSSSSSKDLVKFSTSSTVHSSNVVLSQSQWFSGQYNNKDVKIVVSPMVSLTCTKTPEINAPFSRREALSLLCGLLTLAPIADSKVAAEVIDKAQRATDELNAYEYNVPLENPLTQKSLSWVETRKPERYSSAAPLTPDARLRIVAERLNYKDNIVLTVTIGPPNTLFLPKSDPKEWSSLNVARSVIADKTANRLTPEQRLKEVEIGDTEKLEIDGETYWKFEYLNQKSPTIQDGSRDVYRHTLCVSATKEGYIYTLSASTLESSFSQLQPVLKEAIDSFKFIPPTSDFVPPWKDPWRFW